MSFESRGWAESWYRFQNGDGTAYSVHLMPAEHGGIYIICNESSLWRWHGHDDIKFLCGNDNDYTRKAMLEIMKFHTEQRVEYHNERSKDEKKVQRTLKDEKKVQRTLKEF